MKKFPEKCPTCGGEYNAHFWPESMEMPDKGDFCIHEGWVFVHDELVFDV